MKLQDRTLTDPTMKDRLCPRIIFIFIRYIMVEENATNKVIQEKKEKKQLN